MNNYLEGLNIRLYEKGLDALWLRQKVIRNNIANAETPGFKSKKVEFEKLFSELLESKTHGGNGFFQALDRLTPKLYEKNSTAANPNGNNVSEDEEQIELARAQLQYETVVSALNSEIYRLKYAINGGK